jgi:Lysylphosphatidylglycerol synthase TM region
MRRRWGRTRPVLLVIAVAALLIIAFADAAVIIAAGQLVAKLDGRGAVVVVAAAVLVLIGQVLRALRTRVLINQAFSAGPGPHLGALSIGLMINTAFPLRIGEVVRAWLLARKLRISFLFTFVAIVIERLLDVILVSGLLLGVIASTGGRAFAGTAVTSLAVASFFLALALVAVLLVVVSRTAGARWLISRSTSLLAEDVKRRAQYSIWTVVYGLQRFLRDRSQVARYLTYFVLSWVALFAATAMLWAQVGDIDAGVSAFLVAVVAPFVVASATVQWPAAADFVTSVESALTSGLGVNNADVGGWSSLTWVVLMLPVALIGVVWACLFTVRSARHSVGALSAELPDPANKLERANPGFDKLPEFVGAWLRGGQLMNVLHELEVSGRLSLLRVFKGGSNAITVLAEGPSGPQVRKIVPIAEMPKLRMQYDWLRDHGGDDHIVTAYEQAQGHDWYAISIEYRSTTRRFFDHIHTAPVPSSIELIDRVWSFLATHVYSTGEFAKRPHIRDQYVQDRLLDRVAGAAAALPDLAVAVDAPVVVINGVRLDGLRAVMRRIRDCDAAWSDIASYRSSDAVHGDLTIDNILVDESDGDFLLIDPSDDNILRGPIIDVARMLQSLDYGYEFLNDDSSAVGYRALASGELAIEYRDQRSAQYAALADHVRREVATRYLTGPELRSLKFHEGLFYGRMLSHRVVIDAETALKYYAVCVIAMNEFIDQYEEGTRNAS